jgi:hypothetical protein
MTQNRLSTFPGRLILETCFGLFSSVEISAPGNRLHSEQR